MLIQKSFYFIRHGETNHNAKACCAGGKTDVPLNSKGIEQATLLQAHLKTQKFGAVFSSPMERAVKTAFLATNQTPKISVDLREWELGDFEETPVDLFLKHIRDLPDHVSLPKGESRDVFFSRSHGALNRILRIHDNPLIVAHGGTYWAILHAFQLPYQHIENAACLHFEWKDTLTIKTIGI